MTLRKIKSELREGRLVLHPVDPKQVKAPTEFQRQRLIMAVTTARCYLENEILTTQMIGKTLRVTDERAAQMVRLGVNYMKKVGWLVPVGPPPSHDPDPS